MSDEVKPGQDGANDLAILHPERELEIGGRKVVMREYGFVEGLRLAAVAAPIVHDLSSLTGADMAGGLLEHANLQALFARHLDAMLDMIAQACDQPREWIDGLSDADGQALLLAWWAVNGPFFVRRVLTELQMRLLDTASTGAPSTPRSAAPDTATSSGSAAIRIVN